MATRTTIEGHVQVFSDGWICLSRCPVCAEDARRLRDLERQSRCDEPEVSDEQN